MLLPALSFLRVPSPAPGGERRAKSLDSRTLRPAPASRHESCSGARPELSREARLRSRLVSCLILALVPSAAAAQDAEAKPDPTTDLFVRKCSSCHTVGKGTRVGPDLKGALERRSRSWIEGFVKAPSAMLDTDPQARQLVAQFNGVRMPDLGLQPQEVTSLVDLIARCSAQPCDLAGRFAPVTTATDADIERGRDLFLGHVAQKAGGIPCVSCHTVRGIGSGVPGGLLAKDLTNVFGRLGDQGLDAALKNPAFPAMNKVFGQDHPLSADEVFALRAFLYQANRAQPAADDTASAPLVAAIGTLVVLVVLNAAWARRLRGVRRALTERAR